MIDPIQVLIHMNKFPQTNFSIPTRRRKKARCQHHAELACNIRHRDGTEPRFVPTCAIRVLNSELKFKLTSPSKTVSTAIFQVQHRIWCYSSDTLSLLTQSIIRKYVSVKNYSHDWSLFFFLLFIVVVSFPRRTSLFSLVKYLPSYSLSLYTQFFL